MKKESFLKLFLGVAVVAALALTVNSCKKTDDPCSGITCQNGGTCNNGSCSCATGYEGSRCETEIRAKYLSSVYTVPGACFSASDLGAIATSGLGVTYILVTIKNGCTAGDLTFTAKVNGNTLTFTTDPASCGPNQYTCTGTGVINTSASPYQITFNYEIFQGGISVAGPCSGEIWKKG